MIGYTSPCDLMQELTFAVMFTARSEIGSVNHNMCIERYYKWLKLLEPIPKIEEKDDLFDQRSK